LFLDAAAFALSAGAGLSVVSGLLMLTPSWFMFEVYGRVLNSRNELTLVMLLVAAIGLYVVMELLDLVRARILQRAAERGDASCANRCSTPCSGCAPKGDRSTRRRPSPTCARCASSFRRHR
jgi:ABC-type protease/lipase transport system fused ATPase/permease subunit